MNNGHLKIPTKQTEKQRDDAVLAVAGQIKSSLIGLGIHKVDLINAIAALCLIYYEKGHQIGYEMGQPPTLITNEDPHRQ